jgi:hypothetical protein
MNPEIVGLLERAGVCPAVTWRDVVVTRNFGPVPPPDGSIGVLRNLGFNLIVLEGGSPEHFCKVRPSDYAPLQRETVARASLAGHTGFLMVPPATYAASEQVAVQVGPFLDGAHYGRVIRAHSSGDCVRSLSQILDGAAALSSFAADGAEVFADASVRVRVSDEAARSLDYATRAVGFDPRELDALSTSLGDVGDVPLRPQHGDFWWRNIVVVDDRPWLIDLEDYGEIRVPLFDDFTMVTSTLRLRRGSRVSGLEALLEEDETAEACRELLASRAESDGVDKAQLDGLLTFHVIHRAYTVQRRGGPDFAAPYLEQARCLAEHLVTRGNLLS